MPPKKVLITVTTYPLPSRSHDELVCTAGILETGEMIRIYPVPLSFLGDLKGSGQVQNVKYTWIELDLKKRTDDFRPESHSPVNYDFRDLIIGERLDTKNNWQARKDVCLRNVYTNMDILIDDSKSPKNVSLAVFKPASIVRLEWVETEREWKNEWKNLRKQGDLFLPGKDPEIVIPKLPYKFSYVFTDETGKQRKLMIEDWEIGALYWNCLARAKGDKVEAEAEALQKVKTKYEDEFKEKDLYLFMGTTREWHMRRAKNPFVIIGVFYPKKEIPKVDLQTSLF
ncbi:hypothetical protein [Chitinophaga filiformis]|uniref:Expansin-like CBD domain-containing protein n=1 Tax=Chitinophaga filiformis TaxID=104663 RepID=A0A1G7JID7_CHIFI|nr:hypothetical protein [Chitinophaga filiformis]SDF24663.1 hypothetical protein SAMN04488121_1011250 [Chitinophaga filiformis]